MKIGHPPPPPSLLTNELVSLSLAGPVPSVTFVNVRYGFGFPFFRVPRFFGVSRFFGVLNVFFYGFFKTFFFYPLFFLPRFFLTRFLGFF